MIESIGSVKSDLSVLVDKLVKKPEPAAAVSQDEIKDTHEAAKPAEKYSIYNKNGQVAKEYTVLPDRYNSNVLQGYIYYKGERMTELELLEKAVDMGAIELEEDQTIGYNFSKAWEALVEANAKHLYSWSSGLYSEDGMYKFRVENGEITGMILARTSDGVLYSDMIKDLASGVKPCDMGVGLSDLAHADPELYKAACEIGAAKRMYDVADDRSLFQILFGFKVEDNQKDFVTMALENYNQARYNNWFKANVK